MKKIRRKTKKVSGKKDAESMSKLDTLISQDKFEKRLNEFDRRISKNKQAIDSLLAGPKPFEPVIVATPAVSVVSNQPLVDRYDDVCKEIDKELN